VHKKCFEFPNKKRYNTKKEAEAALAYHNLKNLSLYKCQSCLGWHLTSKNKST